MPSASTAAASTLSRYRPAILFVTGVAAAFSISYAISLVHKNSTPSTISGSTLRRSNAVRRQHRRGNSRANATSSTNSDRLVSEAAIAHVREMVSQLAAGVDDHGYATFWIEVPEESLVSQQLMPTRLSRLQSSDIAGLAMDIEAVPQDVLTTIQQAAHDSFLEIFFAVEFPVQHVIEGTERDYLVRGLMDLGLPEDRILAALALRDQTSNYGERVRRAMTSLQNPGFGPIEYYLDDVSCSWMENGVEKRLQLRVELSRRSQGLGIVAAEGGDIDDLRRAAQELLPGHTAEDVEGVLEEMNGEQQPRSGNQTLMDLLYRIAEDQARRDGYIHRGVSCNSCGMIPIQGVRYRCSNCIDFDLCETCESMQLHNKTHLFYKVRIPAPTLGSPQQAQPVWYPGKPMVMPSALPRPLAQRLTMETKFENAVLDALWDQFRCLASIEWSNDPNGLGWAIDRKTFDLCFVPNGSVRPPPPGLIYDRMFAFYDTNRDGLIGFEEFLKGLASLNHESSHERLKRVFRGFDLDDDGFVERKDFLRMLRAYYALSKELTRDVVAGIDEEYLDNGIRDVILGSAPISSAFPGTNPTSQPSNTGEGKRTNLEGDQEIIDDIGVLRENGNDGEDLLGVVGDAAEVQEFGRVTSRQPRHRRRVELDILRAQMVEIDESDDDSTDEADSDDDADGTESDRSASSQAGSDDGSADGQTGPSDHDANAEQPSEVDGYAREDYNHDEDDWPPEYVTPEDVEQALGRQATIESITDPSERKKVRRASTRRQVEEDKETNRRRAIEIREEGIRNRWARRRFYIDEENGAGPPDGYDSEDDLPEEEDEENYRPPSPRSRSSSKVRFEDDLDADYDTRSNPSTSSRSIVVGERWGGFVVPEAERDAGREILYQHVQQGLNELLDPIFKPKEDLIMEARQTKAERKKWAQEIEEYTKANLANVSLEEQLFSEYTISDLSTKLDNKAKEVGTNFANISLEQLLEESGYSIDAVPISTSAEPQSTSGMPFSANPASSDQSLEAPADSNAIGFAMDAEFDALLEASLMGQPYFDPTLPHHRPTTPQLEAQAASASPGERLAAQIPNEVQHFPPPPQITQDQPVAAQEESAPTPQRLARLAFLTRIEVQAKKRGGHGARLDWREFQELMAGERGQYLAFVGSWIEMASF